MVAFMKFIGIHCSKPHEPTKTTSMGLPHMQQHFTAKALIESLSHHIFNWIEKKITINGYSNHFNVSFTAQYHLSQHTLHCVL